MKTEKSGCCRLEWFVIKLIESEISCDNALILQGMSKDSIYSEEFAMLGKCTIT